MAATGPRPVQPDARGAAGPLPPQDWQAEVEHIQTGRRWTFSTLDELLAFLRRQVEDPEVLRWPTDE